MVSVAVNPPKTPITKMTGDKAPATLPNVCKMPGPPAPFVPTPLPNCGQSMEQPKKTTKKVTIERQKVCVKGSYFMSKMMPTDMPSKPTGGGIITAAAGGKTKFVAPGSMNVKAEGKNIQLLGDAMTNNGSGGGNAGTLPGNVQTPQTPAAFQKAVGKANAKKLCDAACKAMKDKKKADKAAKKKAKAAKKKAKPSTTKNQNKMRENLDPRATRGTNRLDANTGVLTEVGQRVTTKGAGLFIGRMGTATAGGRPYVKWDVILTYGKKGVEKGKLVWDNVKRLIEVKFPGDTFTKNQTDMMKAMGKKGKKVVIMDVDKCCSC